MCLILIAQRLLIFTLWQDIFAHFKWNFYTVYLIYLEIIVVENLIFNLHLYGLHWWILISIHLESATRGLAKVVSIYGMNISKNSFTIFSNGSAYVWFFLILGIYYTHALPIYERIFSFDCRFILDLLHSLTPYFLEDLRHVQYKCDQSQ